MNTPTTNQGRNRAVTFHTSFSIPSFATSLDTSFTNYREVKILSLFISGDQAQIKFPHTWDLLMASFLLAAYHRTGPLKPPCPQWSGHTLSKTKDGSFILHICMLHCSQIGVCLNRLIYSESSLYTLYPIRKEKKKKIYS